MSVHLTFDPTIFNHHLQKNNLIKFLMSDFISKCIKKRVFALYFSRLLGVITKKDVLRHIKQMDNEDPNSVLFN